MYAISLNGQEAGLSVNQPFSLTVREAPAFVSPASTSFTLGAPGTFQVITRGYPVPTITRSGSLPAGLTLNTSTGVLSGTPATGSIGTYRVTLRATNGIGVAAQQALTITVGKRGSSVSAVCVPDPVVPGSASACTATVTDSSPGATSAPSAAVGWSVVTGSGKLTGASCTSQAATRVCKVTFTPGASQTVDQRLKASYPGDASHAASSIEVVIRLIVTTADAYSTPRNQPLVVTAPGVTANDRNVSGGQVALVGGPNRGTLVLRSDGSFTYTPPAGYRGKDAFVYRVRVGTVWSLPSTVTITVS